MKRKSLLIVVFLGLLACPQAGQDPERLRSSCAAGDATACSNLGVIYHTGEGVTQDLARAVILYQQACDGGEIRGCYNLGVTYGDGQGVTQDLARAVILYQQACDGGEMRGCNNLGVMYQFGRGVARDSARAMSLYRQACESGVMQGCRNLRDVADRLFDRAMRAVGVGDSTQAGSLLPMAIAAYQRAGPLDHDGLYHLSVLQRNDSQPTEALTSARAILSEYSDHLLGLVAAAEAAGDLELEDEAVSYYRHLLDMYEREITKALPEYEAHALALASARSDAESYLDR